MNNYLRCMNDGMSDDKLAKIRASLNARYNWPCSYMFKFIAPNDPEVVAEILTHFPGHTDCKDRLSSGGKYISLTIHEVVQGPDCIFSRYSCASNIKGVLAL